MKYLCSLCLCLVAVLCLAGCGGGSGCSTCGEGQIVGTISAQQLWSDLGSATKPRIIDVRDAAAYALSHLPGCGNGCGCPTTATSTTIRQNLVIVGENFAQAMTAGPRALQAGEQARALEGGMEAWPYGLDISARQFTLWLEAGRDLNVIDVRTPAEWESGHLPESINRPLADLSIWAETLEPSLEIVLVCRSGARSATARDQLIQHGFTKVHTIIGGLEAME